MRALYHYATLRLASIVSLIAAGYVGDLRWAFSALAWLIVAVALLLWSMGEEENDGRETKNG